MADEESVDEESYWAMKNTTLGPLLTLHVTMKASTDSGRVPPKMQTTNA